MAKANQLEPVQAVERALQALEIIAENGSMSLNDLHKSIKVNKASLLRTLFTLTENGYLSKDEKSGLYSMTMKTYQVGISSMQNIDRVSAISNVIADLNRATGCVAQFSVEDKDMALVLHSVGQWSSVYSSMGSRVPLYACSSGKAILTGKSNEDILEAWQTWDVKPLTEKTITDVNDFLKEISESRHRGYTIDDEENEYHYFCIGALVRGAGNVPVGAVSITGDSLKKEKQHSKMVMEAANRLSTMLGYIS